MIIFIQSFSNYNPSSAEAFKLIELKRYVGNNSHNLKVIRLVMNHSQVISSTYFSAVLNYDRDQKERLFDQPFITSLFI